MALLVPVKVKRNLNGNTERGYILYNDSGTPVNFFDVGFAGTKGIPLFVYRYVPIAPHCFVIPRREFNRLRKEYSKA